MTRKITILGSGAMATTCSILLAERDDQDVTIWARRAEVAAALSEQRENRRLLPGIRIPERITITSEIARAVEGADYFVAAVPSAFLRDALKAVKPHVATPPPVISVIKGIENETLMRPSEIITDVLGPTGVVALCGPSHAEEVARRLPASVVAASTDLSLAEAAQEMFNTDRFRVYSNTDIVGVELGGALKNVIAIAGGICDGLGFGDNAKAALMTRGLVEMTRFGVHLGAEASTFSGLAGIGDLITTCMSPYGRNRHVGERLGKGESLEEIIASMDSVAEGVKTTRSVVDVARRYRIDMPIAMEIEAVLFENKAPLAAVDDLMSRPLRSE